MRKTALIAAGLVLIVPSLLGGCATTGLVKDARNEFAIARGRSIAQLQCSGCHQVGPTGESPNPMAPSFRNVRMRYNELSLARRMAEVGADGHYEMPGFDLSNVDVDDIAAFIASFKEG